MDKREYLCIRNVIRVYLMLSENCLAVTVVCQATNIFFMLLINKLLFKIVLQ